MFGRQNLALTFIILTVTLDAIGIGLIFPVMPDLMTSVTHGTLSQAAVWGGVITTSFAAMQFLFGPIVGNLSDRFGRRVVLLTSLAVMVVDYVIMAMAQTVFLLLIARVVSGIASATQSTSTAYIADISAPDERARRFGLIGAGFGAGFIAGPLIGGLVASASAGYYNASKFAIEGLSQALQVEVAPFGIRVTVVEPGPFRTDFHGRSMTSTKAPLDAYASTAGARRAQFKASSGKQAGDPVRAADAIIKAVRSPQPPLHLLLGKNALDRARAVYAEFLLSMDEWEQVTLSADFPEP